MKSEEYSKLLLFLLFILPAFSYGCPIAGLRVGVVRQSKTSNGLKYIINGERTSMQRLNKTVENMKVYFYLSHLL